jgi:hypothetical protein
MPSPGAESGSEAPARGQETLGAAVFTGSKISRDDTALAGMRKPFPSGQPLVYSLKSDIIYHRQAHCGDASMP